MAPELRIGTRERELATSVLNEHFAQGRLDHDEYGERLDAIWTARTRADLDQVFWDLPPLTPPRRPVPVDRGRPRGSRFPVTAIAIGLVLLGIAADLPLWILAIVLWVVVAKLRRLRARTAPPRGAGGPSRSAAPGWCPRRSG